MIQVCELTKQYGVRTAVQDVTFEVAPGEILGFLGPNGAGKTTTMRILAGCLAPSSGTARVAGYDVFEQSLEARRSLGYMPEQVPIYPEMRVEEYLLFAGSLRSRDSIGLKKRLGEVLARCGLADVRDRLIGRLSRGYRQRVGLAQAILPNPPALILDEPTVGLDPRQIIDVRHLIHDLSGDHTVILSTHILPEVSMLCNRVVIIDQGRVVAEDTPENLSRAMRGGERLLLQVEGPPEAIAARLRDVAGVVEVQVATLPALGSGLWALGSGPGTGGTSRAQGPPSSPGSSPSPPRAQSPEPRATFLLQTAPGDEAFARGVRREVARAVVEGGYGLIELSAERLTLEDIFVRLVTTEST